MPSEIEEAVHIIYGRTRTKAERSARDALDLIARNPKARGPLVAYVAAASLADEMTLKEAQIRRVVGHDQRAIRGR